MIVSPDDDPCHFCGKPIKWTKSRCIYCGRDKTLWLHTNEQQHTISSKVKYRESKRISAVVPNIPVSLLIIFGIIGVICILLIMAFYTHNIKEWAFLSSSTIVCVFLCLTSLFGGVIISSIVWSYISIQLFRRNPYPGTLVDGIAVFILWILIYWTIYKISYFIPVVGFHVFSHYLLIPS